MQRPGHKINTREANPNPYITFIRALRGKKDEEDAEHILKAVAAQFKTVFERRFMLCGTLEEAAYNGVFAGRNWNHGSTIELVLRRPNGRFYPMSYVISVMCHEMAHITHMNHGPDFQKLNAAIKADVAEMHRRGYYGDGFWSDGKRLGDSVRMGADGLKSTDFPEYICGVTASDAKKSRGRGGGKPSSSRAPGLVKGEASLRSGRQTEYRRKAGRRVNVDMGESSGRLDGRREITAEDKEARQKWIDNMVQQLTSSGVGEAKAKRQAAGMFDEVHPWYKQGSTRGKQAKSKTAAELRAAAAEKRLAALSGIKKEEEKLASNDEKPDVSDLEEPESEGGDSDIEPIEDPHLTAQERKEEIEHDMSPEERNSMRGEWQEFLNQASSGDEAKAPSHGSKPSDPVSDSDDDVVFVGASSGKRKAEEDVKPDPSKSSRSAK